MMNNEIDKYINILFNADNPIYYSLVIVVLVIFLFLIFYYNIFIPNKKKHDEEKLELELKNSRLMALFSELDPDPVIRINPGGEIIHFNNSAKNVFGEKIDNGVPINILLPELITDYREDIKANRSFSIETQIEEKYYVIEFKGTEYLDIAQIYFTDITERKKYENNLRESERKFRELSFYLQENLEVEKQRIGMELHDSIGQNLLLIKMKLNNSVGSISSNENFTEISKNLDSTIADLREIMFNLRPRVLDDWGLPAAVQKLGEVFSKSSEIKGTVSVIGNHQRMNQQSELYLYRIVQECLNNILKHSKAKEFHVQFIFHPGLMKIMISDDGIGFDIKKLNGYKGSGLFNITERIKNLQGVLKINSTENEGTVLTMEVPL